MAIDLDDLNIQLLTSNFLEITPDDWEMSGIESRFWRFYINSDDGVSVEIGGVTASLSAGQAYIIPAGVKFSAFTDRTVGQLFIHFDVHGLYSPGVRELFSGLISLPASFPLLESAWDIALRRQAGEPANMITRAQALGIVYCALGSYLRSLPYERIERCVSQSMVIEPLMPAVRYIEAHLAEPLPIRVLAEMCFMSEGHFIRQFRAGIGHTPVQYILERRVSYAAHLLHTTLKSIDIVAAESGFGSRFYFHRVFTRMVGISPGQYRRSPR